jgi:hypothetical protein
LSCSSQKQLQEIDYLQPNLIKTQKIENKAGNKLAAEGKEDKVIWTDAEDASEKSWKQKLSSIATNTVQIIRETFWTVKIIIGTAVVTLIITSLTIGIIILNKVKISRTQPRRVKFDNNRRQSFDASKQNTDHRRVVFNNDNRDQSYQRQHSGERKI